MEFLKKELPTGELIPVLLGASKEALDTASRLHKTCGVSSHIFCNKVPLLRRFLPYLKFHTVKYTRGEELLLTVLKDFAKQYGSGDAVPYLIPCTEEFVNLVWNHREELEGVFILANSQEMRLIWLEEVPNEHD